MLETMYDYNSTDCPRYDRSKKTGSLEILVHVDTYPNNPYVCYAFLDSFRVIIFSFNLFFNINSYYKISNCAFRSRSKLYAVLLNFTLDRKKWVKIRESNNF